MSCIMFIYFLYSLCVLLCYRFDVIKIIKVIISQNEYSEYQKDDINFAAERANANVLLSREYHRFYRSICCCISVIQPMTYLHTGLN